MPSDTVTSGNMQRNMQPSFACAVLKPSNRGGAIHELPDVEMNTFSEHSSPHPHISSACAFVVIATKQKVE